VTGWDIDPEIEVKKKISDLLKDNHLSALKEERESVCASKAKSKISLLTTRMVLLSDTKKEDSKLSSRKQLRLRFGSWQFTLLCKSLALFLTWDVSSKPDRQDFKLINCQ
jgi:hypothetical protein